MKYDIAIIGGGASGLAAAVSSVRAGARVCVLERQPRVGKKLLATGNGRCNLYNTGARAEVYFGDRAFAEPALRAFAPESARAFFASVGLEIREERNGLLYPASNQAAAVLDCLRLSISEAGAEEICSFDAVSIEPLSGNRKGGNGLNPQSLKTEVGFLVRAGDSRTVEARRVIVAVGGMAAPKLGGGNGFKTLFAPLGHRFAPCYPALSMLKARPEDVAGLKGLKYAGEIALLSGERELKRETGEILFAEDGISGIAAMQLSLYAAEPLSRGERLSVRMSPLSMTSKDAEAFLNARAQAFPQRALEEFCTGVVVKRIGQAALKRAGASPLSRPASSLSSEEIRRLARELTSWQVPVTGIGGFDSAQAMLGGLRAADFDPETLESRLLRGVYACGEALDVTGPCGGYNLAWAWASGILAGRSAANAVIFPQNHR